MAGTDIKQKEECSMKTKEELNVLKKEYDELNRKLTELSEDELKDVFGGVELDIRKDLYENIILTVNPNEHNIMLTEDQH